MTIGAHESSLSCWEVVCSSHPGSSGETGTRHLPESQCVSEGP